MKALKNLLTNDKILIWDSKNYEKYKDWNFDKGLRPPFPSNKPKMAYSRDLPKMAVWHYGLKLQWYLTGDMVWFCVVLYGFVSIVWYGGVMTSMDDWHGWLA